jgi:hypothetical protein
MRPSLIILIRFRLPSPAARARANISCAAATTRRGETELRLQRLRGLTAERLHADHLPSG